MKQLTKKQAIIIAGISIFLIAFIIYAAFSFTYTYPSDIHEIPKALNPVILSFGGNFEIRWYAICVVGGASLLSFYGYQVFLKR